MGNCLNKDEKYREKDIDSMSEKQVPKDMIMSPHDSAQFFNMKSNGALAKYKADADSISGSKRPSALADASTNRMNQQHQQQNGGRYHGANGKANYHVNGGQDINFDEQQSASNVSRSTVSGSGTGVTTSGYSSNSGNSNHSAALVRNKNAYIALFDYDSRTSEDLSFKKGDILYIDEADKTKNGWWMARLRSQQPQQQQRPASSSRHEAKQAEKRGFIPSSYVARLFSLEAEPWYFGETKRTEAEKLLMNSMNENGSFLIRVSDGSNHAYSLSVRDQDAVKHYRIRKLDESSSYYITKRVQFTTLKDLVAYYSTKPDGLTVQLMKPCVKTDPPVTEGLTHNFNDDFEVDRNLFRKVAKIGQGQFGEVWRGVYIMNQMSVAIKTLKEGMNSDDFREEAEIMRNLSHPKLIQLYGLCTSQEPILIITELMSNGSLLEYLQKPVGKRLQIDILVYMAMQIAEGMAYLESRNFIHRDLAARNVLVGENNEVKVADFGLARVVKENLYLAREGTKFPIKWTAPEAALFNKFSVKSDVWSFGIVLYEIVTYGRTPYPSMSNQEVLHHVSRAYRMPKPPNCPDRLYKIMLDCWKANPEERPTFESLKNLLDTFFDDDENRQYRDTHNNSNGTTNNSNNNGAGSRASSHVNPLTNQQLRQSSGNK